MNSSRVVRHVLQHPGDRRLPRLLRRHDPRDDRGARRPHGPVGFTNQVVAPHPVHVRLRRAAVEDAGEGARGAAAALPRRRRSARATAATRTTARRRPGTSSARSASTRCRSGATNYVIGSPLFKKATVHLENGRDLVVKAPNNSARNVYVQGLKLNGRRHYGPFLHPPPGPRRRRRRSSSTWARRPRRWAHRQERRAAVGDEGRRAGAAAARHDGRRRRHRDDERRRRGGAVRQRLEHASRRSPASRRGCSTASPAAGR